MTSKQRAYLSGLASTLPVVVQVGKSGLTPELSESVNEAFNTRELVKITVLNNCPQDARSIAQALAERSRSAVVRVVGKKIILYKRDKDRPKIELP